MEKMHYIYIDENNKIYLNLIPEMIEERIKREKKLENLEKNSLFLGKPKSVSNVKKDLDDGIIISEPILLSEWMFDELFDWFDWFDDKGL